MALRTTALVTGLAMLLPATAWALAMLRWSRSPEVAPGRAS